MPAFEEFTVIKDPIVLIALLYAQASYSKNEIVFVQRLGDTYMHIETAELLKKSLADLIATGNTYSYYVIH